MTRSILWYDYETSGINPRCDRPLQVAAVRTDEDLNEIAPPLNAWCQLADDILPHPAACLVTAITPAQLQQQGLCEAEFIGKLHAQMALPGTCSAGYNTLRFDDEMTRHTLWRNFFDPYAREWQNNNSRWDLIDLVRCVYALRADGIVWPQENGRVSLRLPLLSEANGLAHDKAHDALSDVRATIALARLLKQRKAKLYDYLYRLRSKNEVQKQIRLLQPLLHVSGRFAAARHYLAVVLPLAWHPHNRNALIVYDLQHDPEPLLQSEVKDLRERLYTKRADLAEGQLPLALKLVHINRCPVVAPLSVLREQDKKRLQLDLSVCQKHAETLLQTQSRWQDKLQRLYEETAFPATDDAEQQLYAGFLPPQERRLCEQVRHMQAHHLQHAKVPFSDARLHELFFRYRARNFPQSLQADEQQRWRDFCQKRLNLKQYGAPNTLPEFRAAVAALLPQADSRQVQLLQQWQQYAEALALRYGCP